jgi:hypothetical protein
LTRRDEAGPAGADAGAPMFGIVHTDNEAEWTSVLAHSVQHDFHHLAGYHRLAERRGEGRALLFTYRESGYLIALPLLLRPVDEDDPDGLQDATSVYGYCGPVASRERIPDRVVASFQAALRHELVGRRVVAVFSRLHPLIAQRAILAGLGEIRVVGPTVSVDLTLPLEDQWAGYGKKCRRIIRKAQDEGVICVEDRDGRYRRDWVDIYLETMRRVGAPPSYLFGEDYFDLLAAELGPVLHLFVALVDGRAAAAGLYTICDGIAQAHLGGHRQEYSKLSPVRLLDDTARRWAVDAGARVFHLGGGVGGHRDSLFQYKAGFSDRRHEFATWRWIVDPAAYTELCERRERVERPQAPRVATADYFPAYRRPKDSQEAGA